MRAAGRLLLFGASAAAQSLTDTSIRTAVADWLSNPVTAAATYGHISGWDVSDVTNMAGLFSGATAFDEDLGSWDTGNVVTMEQMFQGATAFDHDIGAWDVAKVTNFGRMFMNAQSFSHSVDSWSTTSATTMFSMFKHAKAFDHGVGSFSLSNVVDLGGMFTGADAMSACSKALVHESFSTQIAGRTVSGSDWVDAWSSYSPEWACPAPPPAPYVCANGLPCAASSAPLRTALARTTVQGWDIRTDTLFNTDEPVAGPFLAQGLGASDADTLRTLGCTDPSDGYVQAGIDSSTAEKMIAHACGVELPRVDGEHYISLLDECGARHGTYTFHERLSCLYGTYLAPYHSRQIAAGENAQATPLYGKWEDYSVGLQPDLDACGGHFGLTPDSDGAVIYHHHVQEAAPFTYGCYGPAADYAGRGKMVTVEECRALYPNDCGNGDLVQITTSEGTFSYDLWCPCFDATGSNAGGEVPAAKGVFGLSGDVADYDGAKVSIIQTTVAKAAGVVTSSVAVTVVSASVSVSTVISLPNDEAVSTTITALSSGIFSSSSALEAALISEGLDGVTVTSSPSVTATTTGGPAAAAPSPPDIAVLFPGCTESDLQTDLDANGRPTLGDAVFVANARLEYGTTGVNPLACMEGDYDSDGTFTLNDAAQVAMSIFGKATLPWTDYANSLAER